MVESPRWFVGFDSVMELFSFIIAFAVAYQAFKGYRLTKERTFLHLEFSFVLLAAGLLVDGLSTLFLIFARTATRIPVKELGNTVFFLAQLVAYVILVYAYLQKTRGIPAEGLAAVAILPLLGYNPIGELILIFLLFFITAQEAVNYGVRRSAASMLVLLAFAMLTFSHVFFFFSVVSESAFFVLAHISQLAGFVLLLVMLLQVNRAT